MNFLKIRDVPDMQNDPRFDYMVGRLVGTCEMMAFYMKLHGDTKAQGMADRAYSTLNFFFDPHERVPTGPYPQGKRVPTPAEATTLVGAPPPPPRTSK